MFMNESLMTTVFKILNIGILFSVLGYLIKKNVLPGIKEGIKSHGKMVRRLKTEHTKLQTQSTFLENEIAEQQDEGDRLLHNLKQWHSFEKERKDTNDAYYALRQKETSKRRSMQLKALAYMKTKREVVNHALDTAQSDLVKQFDSSKEGKDFLSNIIMYFEGHKG